MKNQSCFTIFHTTVFSNGHGGGNPCPVVIDTDSLASHQGMSLAKKYMAETIFVTSAKDSRADFGLRYFVPHHEMEMCVHGTIAAVTVLHAIDRMTVSPVKIETALGIIPVDWEEHNGDIIVTVNQFPPEFSTRNPAIGELVDVLQLPGNLLIREDLPIISVSTSRPKLIVPIEGVQTLNQLQPDYNAMWSLCEQYDTTGIYPFSPVSTVDDARYAARQFPANAGYNEDPATGVAACALGAYLAQYHSKKQGWNTFDVLQGYAMGRPSIITARAFLQEKLVRKTGVTGKADIQNRERVSPGC